MDRNAPLLLGSVHGLGFLLLILFTGGPLAAGRPRRTELHPADDLASIRVENHNGLGFYDAAAEVHDLAALTPAEDARLDEKRCQWRVTMARPPDGQGDKDVYEVLPLNDPQSILQLDAGPDAKGKVVVDATMKVIHHPRLVVGPVDVAGFVEYRLVDAMRAEERRRKRPAGNMAPLPAARTDLLQDRLRDRGGARPERRCRQRS